MGLEENACTLPNLRAMGRDREELRRIFNKILPFLEERCGGRASALSPHLGWQVRLGTKFSRVRW